MNNDRNLLVLAVLAGLVIGWLLGAGWWQVPGRSLGVLLAILLIVVLIGRSRNQQSESKEVDIEAVDQKFPEAKSMVKKSEMVPTAKPEALEGEVLSPEAARKWLDDLLEKQQQD